ncbi:MAG: methytransferase partner Trm112 [Methanoculleus sp.]
MKKSLMEIICCPVCKGGLELIATEESGEEVLEGTLRCAVCSVDYPISEGIPNLLPQTAGED